MSSSAKGGQEFYQVSAILKELEKEDLLDVFIKNKLSDDVLECLDTQPDMRTELRNVNILSGDAIKFSKRWFCYKKTDQNVPTTSKESISEGAGVSEPTVEKEKSQSKNLKIDDQHYENSIPEKATNSQTSKIFRGEREINVRRQFGKLGKLHYVKGNVLPNIEDKSFEFKALTQESPQKLPWKIMDKARPFICGILNGGGRGIIYFGIGDSYNSSTNFKRGEIIGLEITDLKDEINKAFQSTLDDHIKSDNGKMTKGGDMNCVDIYFVPVWDSGEPTSRCVVEIEVTRTWMFCQDYVYYFQEWIEKRPKERGAKMEKTGLHNLYTIKDNWKDCVIRTQGSSMSVKAIETAKQVKEPLSKRYKEWQAETKDKQSRGLHNIRDTESFDIQKLSTNVRKSLKDLDFRENSYILIANKVPLEYRGSNILGFLRKIPWIVVFDLFDLNTENDGLYYMVNETNDCARPIKKELSDFKDPKINETLSKVETTWVTRSKEMQESSWTKFSRDFLNKALTAFCESPTGRAHCVFLLLNNENLEEMADIVDFSFTIIRGNDANKHISIISERKEFGSHMIKFLKDDISKDVKPPCSVFGIPLDLLGENVKALLGSEEFDEPEAMTDLPYLNGTLRPVLNKRIKSLTDLEVYTPNPKLSTELEDIKKAKENFYMGNVITQMNLFHNDAIERTLETSLIGRIDECLETLSSPEEVELFVETITLRYESGSGATTLGRQILWKKRENYRCAVVKKISEKTDYQIGQLQTFLYGTSEISPLLTPPVLILVDNIQEQQVHHLSDRLSRNKTRCILLSMVPLDKLAKDNSHDFFLGKLNRTETERVRGVLSTLNSERKKEAAVVLDRERRFMWLGLELFGRKYAVIKPRLSTHILQVLSQCQLKEAYEMILHLCCLLDYYSKRRFIYPQPCVEEILLSRSGPDIDDDHRIDNIHDKFGGLLLEEMSESVGYYGWKPAHALVGEVVREGIDLFETAIKLVKEINRGNTYVKKFLTEDVVTVFLQREKMAENPPDNESDGMEDEFLGILEVRTKYSQLILDILSANQEEQHVKNALDLLLTLNEEVTTIQHKARTFQQIARMLAYEIGMNEISESFRPLVERINKIVSRDNNSVVSPENGFDIAHRVINEATNLQRSYLHHVVTKATFYRIKLKHLHENITRNHPETEKLKKVIEEAIVTTKKGIELYDNTLKTKNRDSYLHAMIGKIQTIVVIVEMFKKLPFFAQHRDGQDESFRNYVTFQNHPDELKTLLTDENMDYFSSLTTTAVHILNDFLGEIQIRRKLSYKKHEIKELENAKIRAMKLRTQFYEATNLDRTNTEQGVVLKEDIVNDLLYKNHESPFSSWIRLNPKIIDKIYALLKDAIPNETTSHNAMLTYARAALQTGVHIDNLLELIERWCMNCPNSEWAHMFSYMIHFPVPNNSLKTNIAKVKSSVGVCRERVSSIRPGYRRSGAEYLLGKGVGVNSIIPPHHVVMSDVAEPKTEISRSRDAQLETEFWRSKLVYEKLERLSGKKNLTKKGVLTYRGIEIPFDNDRYPHESRDELWFYLGYTITGPYAYDPIDKDTYKEIRDKFQGYKNKHLSQTAECPKSTSPAWQTEGAKPKPLLVNQSTTQNPDAKSPKTKTKFNRTAAPSTQAETQISVNKNTRKESAMAGRTLLSGDNLLSTGNEETWKTDPKYKRAWRSNEGHQKTFAPKFADRNKVYHGAQVQGANKSVECIRHKSKNFPTKCTFAHTEGGDPVIQTICELCTNKRLNKCINKEEHERHHYNLGPFLTVK